MIIKGNQRILSNHFLPKHNRECLKEYLENQKIKGDATLNGPIGARD